MTKEQFLFQLEQLLLDLPQEEREEAIAYYREYFNDAGSENEDSIIEELGTPEKVAASIREGLDTDTETGTVDQPPQMRGAGVGEGKRTAKRQGDARSKWILIILVAVFTFPLWIGVAGTAFGLIVAAVLTVLGVSIAIAAVAVVGIIGGVIAAIVGIMRFATGGFASGLMTFGVGMLLVALGCLCAVLMLLLFGKFVPWLLRAVSNLFHNGRRKPANKRKEVGVNG